MFSGKNEQKVVAILNENDGIIKFTGGYALRTFHEQECCEGHYWSLSDLNIEDFKGLKFDLNDNNFFERILGYGIRLVSTNGFPISIPAYGINNGYYSNELTLVLYDDIQCAVIKEFDITECQQIDE